MTFFTKILGLCLLLLCIGASSCRRDGCPTFDYKTEKYHKPKGNKNEDNTLFGKKMDSYQNSSKKKRRPSHSKADKNFQ